MVRPHPCPDSEGLADGGAARRKACSCSLGRRINWSLDTASIPSNFLATFLGNTLYLSALIYYTYITFLGYNALPFLHNTELLLLPILVLSILWLVSLIAGWGVVMHGHSVEWLFWGV
ncbi:hypothetical protein V6Z94_004296 [Aspergillus fumigatus]